MQLTYEFGVEGFEERFAFFFLAHEFAAEGLEGDIEFDQITEILIDSGIEEGEELVVKFLILILLRLNSDSIPLLENFILALHEGFDNVGLGDRLLIGMQFLLVVLFYFPRLHHLVVDFVGPAVLYQRFDGQTVNVEQVTVS